MAFIRNASRRCLMIFRACAALEEKEYTFQEQQQQHSKGVAVLGRLQDITTKQPVVADTSDIPQYRCYDMCNNGTMFVFTSIQCYIW